MIPFIDLKAQYRRIEPQIRAAIDRVLEHGQYIMGPEVAELERVLAAYSGVRHVITCSSGTDALLMPLMAEGIGPGDAVFTSSFSFFATGEVIIRVGATPIFVDIEPDTFNMDAKLLDDAILSIRNQGELVPRMVMPVDLFGLPADYDRINQVADSHGLKVLADAAQSFGGEYGDRKVGSLAWCSATSFYPAKPLGCYGDGGAIFTDDSELHEKLLSIRVHGQSRNDKYLNERIGITGRMDTIQAAVLIEKIKIFGDELDHRRRIAEHYSSLLPDALQIPRVPAGRESAWAQFSVLCENRRQLLAHLANHSIPTACFYPVPIHAQQALESSVDMTGQPALPITDDVSKRIFSLPFHPYLSNDNVEEIAEVIGSHSG